MKRILFPFLLIVLLWGCNSTPQEPVSKSYELVEDDGIYVEVFDSTNVDENRYTDNNSTFQEGRQFSYVYYHLTPEGDTLLFADDPEKDDWQFGWKFVRPGEEDENTIEKVVITVKPGLQPFINNIPDYNQTIIQFDYFTPGGRSGFNSMSGAIENEQNIWIHPPRDKYFRILELNPFPFIQAPYEVGNTWDWALGIGSSWGDERWITWEGSIQNTYQYEITDQRKVATKIGDVECFEITGRAESRIGKTGLVALFSPEYGFVQLDYTNIDGSKTVLDLVEFKEP